ncbi:Protein KTI12-like protein, partial [Stegodyphus mimosarum]
MPLVIICGVPCSGKSQIAKKLNEFLQLSNRKSVIIKDDDIATGFQRNEVYADARKEKEFRASLKSEVERYLSKDTVVILDSSNYIKGCRCELYCLSKACQTTQCVILCDLLPSDCWSYNEEREPDTQYEKDIFDALVQRFETPDSRNRWDSPLFIVHKNEELPLSDIENALFARKALSRNLSTQCQPLESTNFLYDLDKNTTSIVKAILEAQKMHGAGDIVVPGTKQKVSVINPLTTGELTRIRRQFISYTKSHPVKDSSRIPDMFVQYINKSIQ